MFPIDLLGLFMEIDIDCAIDLELGTKPNLVPPSQMALAKPWELNIHLENLLGKGFICLSMLQWGTYNLFVKKG